MQSKYHQSLLQGLAVGIIMMFSFQAWADIPMIFMPFRAGSEWRITQYPNLSDNDSHKGSLTWAYDFGHADRSLTDGFPVLAPATGDVVEARYSGGWGNTVIIRSIYDGESIFIRVAHLKYTPEVRVGDQVDQGDLIGYVGNTGNSSSPHMHIQVQSSQSGNSIEFEFVEPIKDGRIRSLNVPRTYVIDENGRTNAGSLLLSPTTTRYGTWYASSTNEPLVIDGRYMYTNTTNSYLKWNFQLYDTGRYEVFATCRNLSTRSSNTEYRFYGPGVSAYNYVDQRYFNSGFPGLENMYFVGRFTASSLGRFYVRTRKIASGSVCADSVFVRHLD